MRVQALEKGGSYDLAEVLPKHATELYRGLLVAGHEYLADETPTSWSDEYRAGLGHRQDAGAMRNYQKGCNCDIVGSLLKRKH